MFDSLCSIFPSFSVHRYPHKFLIIYHIILLDFLFFHMFLKLPEHLPVPSRKTDISSCPFPLQLNFAVYLCNISIHNTPHNTCIHYISHNRFLNSHVCFLQSFSKTILKIIPYYRTVFHSESSVFFVCHIVEIGLPLAIHCVPQEYRFFVRFLFDLIQQIMNPLCGCRVDSPPSSWLRETILLLS